MDDVLGYRGKKVVVTGAASGMGAAAAGLLVEVGAEVIGLDVKPTDVPVASFLEADLGDRASIDHAVAAIGAGVASVFSVAGRPGPTFSDVDTMLVYFVGPRHLIESLLPTMAEGASIACVASTAGLGWQQRIDELLPLITSEDFEAG